jgi:hypothetical protein
VEATKLTLRRLLACAAPILVMLAIPAQAGLYRCQLPDGRTTFTDDPSKCPGAQEHELSGRVETVTTHRPAAPARALRQPSLETRARADQARKWREKRLRAEGDLVKLGERREKLRSFVTHCNRGGEVIRRDSTGIKHTISCTRVRRDYASLEKQQEEIRAYLDEGLEDECRRAGCLPGWIR